MVPQTVTGTRSVMIPQLDDTRQPEKAGSPEASITDRHMACYSQTHPQSELQSVNPDLSFPMTGTQPITDNGTARQPEHQSPTASEWLIGKQPIYTPS